MQFTYDYRGMGQWLVGPEAKALVDAKANEAARLFQAIVAKRTGRLAESARVTTKIGGLRGRRWQGVLTVGGDDAVYGAAYEFGTDKQSPHDDLRRVLEGLR